MRATANVRNAIDYFESHELGCNQAGHIGQIDLQYSIDGGEWQGSRLAVAWRHYEGADEVPSWNGIHETDYLDELHVTSEVRARARYNGADADGNPRCSDWSNLLTLNEKADFTAHDWAKAGYAQATREAALLIATRMVKNLGWGRCKRSLCEPARDSPFSRFGQSGFPKASGSRFFRSQRRRSLRPR